MGDSNAQMWIPAFTEVAKDRNLSLSLAITPACAWQRGVNKPFAYGSMANCDRNRSDAYDRVIPALDPDLIVVVNTREPHGPPQRQFVDNRYNRALRDSTPASLGELATPGREVLIIGEAPLPEMIDVNPLSCLAKADVVEACRFVADATTTWLDRVQVEAASDIDGVTMVDFDRLICPFLPICDPVIGDTVTFWNQEHITARFSRSLAPDVERYLQDQGFIP